MPTMTRPTFAQISVVLAVSALIGGLPFLSLLWDQDDGIENGKTNMTTARNEPDSSHRWTHELASHYGLHTADILKNVFANDREHKTAASLAEPRIWFFVELKEDRLLAIFMHRPASPEAAPVAKSSPLAPEIALALYRFSNSRWELQSAHLNLTELGSYGEVPEVIRTDVMSVAPGVKAVAIPYSWRGQGVTTEGRVLISLTGGVPRDLGFIKTYEDNAGLCDEETAENLKNFSVQAYEDFGDEFDEDPLLCKTFVGEIFVEKVLHHNFFDLKVAGAKRSHLRRTQQEITYRFNGLEYTLDPTAADAL